MKRSARRLVAGAILLAALLLAMALPYLASSFYVNVATQVLFFGLFGMSIDLLGGYTGLMPLGHAGILGVGGYSMGYGLSRLGWSWPQAAAVALLLTVLVSLVFGLLAVRTTGIFFVMITMAEGMLVWGLAYRWASVTGAENGLRGISRPEFAVLYWQYYYFALLVFLVSALALTLIVRSPFGLTLKGIRESESRMRTLGYNVTLHKLLAFVLSGFFAGLAGLLYAWYNQFISPTAVNITPSTEGILMVVSGGAGTLLGPVLGAAVIVLVKNLLSTYVARWPTILGLIFIGVVLFAPDGIVGAARRGWARLRAARQSRVEGMRSGDAGLAAPTVSSSVSEEERLIRPR